MCNVPFLINKILRVRANLVLSSSAHCASIDVGSRERRCRLDGPLATMSGIMTQRRDAVRLCGSAASAAGCIVLAA
jgi:hypothetical protein